MKPKAKQFLLDLLFGLFSNDKAMDGAKSFPWWSGLIIALFGVTIPIIPITVSQARSYGSSFLSGYTYRFDQNIANLTVDMASSNQEFIVENQELSYYENNSKVVSTSENDTTPVSTYISEATGQYELMVYYTTREKTDLNHYLTNIAETTYKNKTAERPDDSYEGVLYTPSFVVLHKGGLYTRLYKEDSTEVGSNTYTAYVTDWKHFDEGYKLIAGALPKDKTASTVNLNDSEDVNAIFNNWKTYYNKGYISQRTYNTWMTSLIFLGIHVGLVFFMGLLLFLLTRGKNNMFNYLKFIDTQKMIWWACLSPGILAMIVGFLLSNFAQMIFLILLGLRVMWMSMKQLRPQQY